MRPTEPSIGRWLMALLMLMTLSPAQAEMAQQSARNSSRDVKLPRALVQQLEKDYRSFLTKNEVSSQTAIQRTFLNFTAELTQNHPAALHEDVKIQTPLGGGVVDLADFVTPLRGAFKMRLRPTVEGGTEPADLRIFFVSHAKARKLEGEVYGAGCDRFMEITHYFIQRMASGGFELYTAGQRYLSVVGGTFVAVAFAKESMSVASLTFEDSRYPELMCE